MLIEGVPCEDLKHDFASPHSKLTCKLSPGNGVELTLAIAQAGQLAFAPRTVILSYEECKLGEYEDRSGACLPCPPGSASDSSCKTCRRCGVGTYAPHPGMTACLETDAGSFVNITGATRQRPCPPGWYSVSRRTHACLPCPVGRANKQEGKVECDKCPQGTAQDKTAQLTCNNCLPGRYR